LRQQHQDMLGEGTMESPNRKPWAGGCDGLLQKLDLAPRRVVTDEAHQGIVAEGGCLVFDAARDSDRVAGTERGNLVSDALSALAADYDQHLVTVGVAVQWV
jgi:hypothetical protein